MTPRKSRKFTIRNASETCPAQMKAVTGILFDNKVLYKVSIGKVFISITTEPISLEQYVKISDEVKKAKGK